MLIGTWSTLSSRGSPPTSRERVSDREVKSNSVDNPRIKGVNERRNRVTNVCKGEEDQEGEVTDNGSLEKGTVKGSVFPGEVTLCTRYLEHRRLTLVYPSTEYFQPTSFAGRFKVVCSLYGTIPGTK